MPKEGETPQRGLQRARRRAAISTAIAAVAVIGLASAVWLCVCLAEGNHRHTEFLIDATVAESDKDFPTLVENLRAYQTDLHPGCGTLPRNPQPG